MSALLHSWANAARNAPADATVILQDRLSKGGMRVSVEHATREGKTGYRCTAKVPEREPSVRFHEQPEHAISLAVQGVYTI